MITIPEIINERTILYLDIQQDLKEFESADLKNWVLFVIEDDADNPVHEQFAEICIDKEVLYVCAAGKACSEMDDLFDMTMVMRMIEGRRIPSWYQSDDDVLMTTWHHNFEEGFWFVTSVASYEEMFIDTVLVVNLTAVDYLPVIRDLTKKIAKGWLPSD